MSRRTKKPSMPKAADRPRTLATRKGPCLRAVGWSEMGWGPGLGKGSEKNGRREIVNAQLRQFSRNFTVIGKRRTVQ